MAKVWPVTFFLQENKKHDVFFIFYALKKITHFCTGNYIFFNLSLLLNVLEMSPFFSYFGFSLI